MRSLKVMIFCVRKGFTQYVAQYLLEDLLQQSLGLEVGIDSTQENHRRDYPS